MKFVGSSLSKTRDKIGRGHGANGILLRVGKPTPHRPVADVEHLRKAALPACFAPKDMPGLFKIAGRGDDGFGKVVEIDVFLHVLLLGQSYRVVKFF